MKIDLILPPRKEPVSILEKPLISEDVNIICKEPLKIHLGSNLSSFVEKALYRRYVKSKIGKGTVKHMITEGLCYMLHFMPMDNVVVTCHGINIPYLDYFSSKNRFVYDYNLKGMKKADRIIAVSKEAKKDIISYVKYPEDRIDVVYHGVDHKTFFPNHTDEIKETVRKRYNIGYGDKIILNVGSEQPRKNIPTLFKAFYKLKKTMPNVKLLRVGHFDWKGARKKSNELIKQLHLEKDIIYAGVYPNEELPQFYNAADLFVFPSYSEGFGIPNLEALACGCPVITTDKTSIPEVVGDAAIKLSDPFDVDLMARTMEGVLTNDGLREDMIKKGLEQANKFSWEKYAKETYEVYERVWNEK
jgi:glycosyltransferase involved in cell wall biosynthesis